MFGFGKKKKQAAAPLSASETSLSSEEKEQLHAKIKTHKAALSQTSDEEQAERLEEIGLWYQQLQEEDQAIESLEASLAKRKSTGAGYKALLKLYNKKRAAAAAANDEAQLQIYLGKIDYLMQVSKDVTRGVK